jgi:hypothetical protein
MPGKDGSFLAIALTLASQALSTWTCVLYPLVFFFWFPCPVRLGLSSARPWYLTGAST